MPHTIALAQCGSLPDTTKNLKTAEYFIHQAANAGAALIVFPEYFMYPCIGDPTLYVNHSPEHRRPFCLLHEWACRKVRYLDSLRHE